MLTKKHLNNLTYDVLGAAIEVHQELGPGLLESVYHRCLKEELEFQNINFKSELAVPIKYKRRIINVDLRCDFLIENCLVVELKAIQELHPVFDAQVLTYMKLLNVPKGILINFFCDNIFKNGQKTFVNEFFRDLPER